MRIKWQVLLALCFLTVAVKTPAQASGDMEGVANSYNAFGFKLLSGTRHDFPGKNVFLSPLGLGLTLSMAANGARANTLSQILATLEVKPDMPDLNSQNQALTKYLSHLNTNVTLEIANSLWTADDAKILPPFSEALKQSYDAEAASVNFKDPATAQKINAWCGQHTRGKISKFVEPPLDASRLILLDAIYFKGAWADPFDKKFTHDAPFTLADGRSVSPPRMVRTGRFQYFENDAFQAVRLPYAGRSVSMYVFLPRKNLDSFLQALTPASWRQWTLQMRLRHGALELPRFKLENEYKLNEVLKTLGMRDAFTRLADFRGIAEEPLYVDWIKQKTFIDVNEQGTEAAAVSGIGVVGMAVHREEPPFHMIVNHPFFVAVQDSQSGAILFLGAIVDPSQ